MLRYMKESDLPQVCAIEESCFSRPWSRDSLAKALSDVNNVYTVAVREDGKIGGYCGIWGVGQTGEICNMAVDISARSCGIGRTLLQFTLDVCRRNGIKEFTLEVRESNLHARSLYEHMGFVCEGVRRGYYSLPTEDAMIMWLRDNKSKS